MSVLVGPNFVKRRSQKLDITRPRQYQRHSLHYIRTYIHALSPPEPHTQCSSSTNQTENYFYNQVAAIVANGSNYTTKCEKCLASTNVFHEAAISQPVSVVTDLLIRVCGSSPYTRCRSNTRILISSRESYGFCYLCGDWRIRVFWCWRSRAILGAVVRDLQTENEGLLG